MEFDWDVFVTIKIKAKTPEQFDAFMATLKDKLSQARVAGTVEGSKITAKQDFTSKEWHDGIE